MKNQDLDALTSAYAEKSRYYDENLAMLTWYAQRIVRTVRAKSYRSVLSLGIGYGILPKALLEALGSTLDRYAVVEGSSKIVEAFRAEAAAPRNMDLIHSLFEDFRPAGKFDVIEMGFVLEHVSDPGAIVRQYSQFVTPGGTLFIAVPNARSLHRLVGHEAGLLDNLHRLSTEDLQLGHQRYFDFTSLCKLVLDAGLKIVRVEGILLKPLTSGQLKSLNLSPPVLESFLKLGVDYPEICNAILIEATP